MKGLGLGLTPEGSAPTPEALEAARVKAVRAARLASNEDFVWWRGLVTKGIERRKHTLVWSGMPDCDIHMVRGIIQGLEKVLKELDTMAAGLAAFDKGE